jgi:hypothetical protein
MEINKGQIEKRRMSKTVNSPGKRRVTSQRGVSPV